MRGQRNLLMAFGAAALVILLAWYMLVFRSKGSQIAGVSEDIETAAAELQSLQATLGRLEGIDADRPELEADLRRLVAGVPPQPELGSVILTLHELAARSDLAFLSVTPAPPAAAEGLSASVIALSITVEGDFPSVVDFLQRAEDLERILVADSIQLTASEFEALTPEEEEAPAPASSTAQVVTLEGGGSIAAVTDAATVNGQATPTTAPAPTVRATLAAPPGSLIALPAFIVGMQIQARMFTTAPPPAPAGGEGETTATTAPPATGGEGETTTTTAPAAQSRPARVTTSAAGAR